MDTTAQSWEPVYANTAEAMFKEDHRALSALLTEATKKALRRKATIDWQQLGQDATLYVEGTSVEQWKAAFHPVIVGTVQDQASGVSKAMFGAKFDVPNLYAERWLEQYELQFAQQISSTSNEAIRQLLQAAQAEGWSIPETQKRLDALFEQWGRGTADPALLEWLAERYAPHRTEMIARTESLRASNFGLYSIYQGWGIQLKSWMATHDPRTRIDHLKAGEAYAEGGNPGPIPFDQPFLVGGYQMMMPHDPSAPADQTINCRCVVAPIVGDADVQRIREQAAQAAQEGATV